MGQFHWYHEGCRPFMQRRFTALELVRAKKLAVERAQGAQITWAHFEDIFRVAGVRLADAARILGTTDSSLKRWRKKGWVDARQAQRLAMAMMALERETLQGCVERIDAVLRAFQFRNENEENEHQ